MVDLTRSLPVGTSADSSAISKRGDVAGALIGPNEVSAALWTRDGKLEHIGKQWPGAYSRAQGINDDGTVVGFRYDPTAGDVVWTWKNGKIKDILSNAGTPSINNRGQVAATRTSPDRNEPVIWDHGKVKVLPGVTGPGYGNSA